MSLNGNDFEQIKAICLDPLSCRMEERFDRLEETIRANNAAQEQRNIAQDKEIAAAQGDIRDLQGNQKRALMGLSAVVGVLTLGWNVAADWVKQKLKGGGGQ